MSKVVETKVKINVEATGGEPARATIGSTVEAAPETHDPTRQIG